MRKIAHISDVHFGREDRIVVERLIEKICELQPDAVVVSGDLTQRARRSQFERARAMLDRMPVPQIVVPGNHDVPLYNVLERFINPFDNYKKYISKELQPFYLDDELAIVGINTARSLTIKGGRINAEQVAAIRVRMADLSEEMLKVVVTHHPFEDRKSTRLNSSH